MVTPAFGFSVGDFISAINLVKKVSRALKDAGGASSEYQQVVIELKGLENGLQHLEALEPTEDNASHVNAIRGMALACQLPLREFLTKLERYESSMGPFAPKHSFRGAGWKAKWAVALAADVDKLRALVAAKVLSINLLLATHSSQTLSKMESRGKRQHSELMAMIVEHRQGIGHIQEGVQRLQHGALQAQRETNDNVSRELNTTSELRDKVNVLSENTACSNARLASISSAMSSIQSSIMSLRGLGEQVTRFISTFPTEIRDLLQKILRTNLQIYWLLLRSQNSVSASPSLLCQSNIQFEDALGRVKGLPFEWFRHWEAFEGLLRADFKDVPGETNVLDGHYHIVDTKRRGSLIRKEDWSGSIFPGSAISMSMIISLLRREGGLCPRPSCKGEQGQPTGQSDLLICPECGLKYYTSSSDLELGFERVTVLEEDDEVAQRQAKEDLLLHGSRPKPQDPEEFYASVIDPMELDSPARTRKRMASEMQASEIERPSKTRKEDVSDRRSATNSSDRGEQASPNNNVTAIDWNSGKSPLDAWLNQSALPSPVLPLEPELEERGTRDRKATAREMKEIEFFRNVHISASDRVRQETEAMDLNGVSDIDFGAQIYYRNIVDSYPLIPPYLARRLAEANFHRAERLRCQRVQAKQEKKTSHPKCMSECRNTAVRGNEEADSSQILKATASESFRYRVTLTAPTAMVKNADEISVTYLNSGQLYWISILDTTPPWTARTIEYRTSVRITSETEEHGQKPMKCWKKIRGAIEANQRGGKFQAVECAIETVESTHCGLQSTPVNFETASVDGFSVEWIASGCGSLECNIPVRFKFLSTDFSYLKGVEYVPFQLCVKTEMVRQKPLRISTMPEKATELCHCIVKLFPDHGAERQLSTDILIVKEIIKLLKRQEKSRIKACLDDKNELDEEELQLQLQTLENQLLEAKSVTLFNLPGDGHGDPDSHPLSIETELHGKRNGEEHSETSFWTGGSQNYRPPSMRSGSSSMNSSLHGTPTFDPEEQNPVFIPSPRPRLRKSSGYCDGRSSPLKPSVKRSPYEFDGSSASIPPPLLPPPHHLARLSPNVDPSSSVVSTHLSEGPRPCKAVDGPPTLPPPPVESESYHKSLFDCDICGETVKITSPSEWQDHVFADLRPYLCTFPECKDSEKTYRTRLRFVNHEMNKHRGRWVYSCRAKDCYESFKDGFAYLQHIKTHQPEPIASLLNVTVNPLESSDCLFCGKQIGGGSFNLARHVGRHMEQISFAVVTKPYEDWESYRDSSIGDSSNS